MSNTNSFNFYSSSDDDSVLINETITKISENRIVERIWQKDHTVWNIVPTEISNRLGWLDCISITQRSFDEIYNFVEEIKNEGFTNALLLGMGGSSLAPEVFRKTFGVKPGYLNLDVLDSTHPEAVLEFTENLNPLKTLYIVSTKSGGTIETISFLKYFFNLLSKKIGKENAPKHFIAITDPGSGLQKMAEELKFRKIFLNDPDIGGRFSALSLFGIVPAALIGVDINILFQRLARIVEESKIVDHSNFEKNSSALLGAIIGSLAVVKKDKLTFILSKEIQSFGAWVEQLIAESTGKSGMGILPVESESLEIPGYYAKDRVFVNLRINNDSFNEQIINEYENAGFPVIKIDLEDIYDLGAEFFRWEFATAIAGWKLGIQPYDQPNVESAKIVARKLIQDYETKGQLQELVPVLQERGIRIFGNISATNLKNAFEQFFSNLILDKGDKLRNYVSLHAYLKPEENTTNLLQAIRTKIQKKYKIAVTLGYGPRFLHSTGQLHKGDGGNGFFIQFISDFKEDVGIPKDAVESESTFSFGILIKAQALGDRQALIDNNRNLITVDLGKDVNSSLEIVGKLL